MSKLVLSAQGIFKESPFDFDFNIQRKKNPEKIYKQWFSRCWRLCTEGQLSWEKRNSGVEFSDCSSWLPGENVQATGRETRQNEGCRNGGRRKPRGLELAKQSTGQERTFLWETEREWKDRPQSGRKYLQITSVMKDFYLEYIMNPQNLIVSKHPNLKNG